MDSLLARSLCLIACAIFTFACEKQPEDSTQHEVERPAGKSSGTRPAENIDAAEKAAAANLKPSTCPVQEAIYAYRLKVRQAYNNSRFDELEKMAAEARQKKEVFGNGSWKIAQFYSALDCREDEAEGMWRLHDDIHRAWLKAKPQSITAHVALAEFLVDYGWKARGTGFAHTVSEAGWKLFEQRLAEARETLRQGSALPEKDPVWALTALTVARGQGWNGKDIDVLVDEASAAEPEFWGYHTERAVSLLPRWHGKPGDWERYAEKVAARPEGLGDEIYARIVLSLHGYFDNVFEESKASWPKTRAGLEKMLQKYPESLELLSRSASLAAYAQDLEFAKARFEQLGTRYLPSVWRRPERFMHFKTWAETGRW